MKQFEIGKIYYARSICNQDCAFAYKITARTAKTVTLWDTTFQVNIGRRKITILDDEETISPKGKYSMAPLVRASNICEEV